MMILLLVNRLVDTRLTSDRSNLSVGRNNGSNAVTSLHKTPSQGMNAFNRQRRNFAVIVFLAVSRFATCFVGHLSFLQIVQRFSDDVTRETICV